MTGVRICTLVGATRIIPGAFQRGMGVGGITIRHRALSIWRCTILTSITLPNSLTTIGRFAFQKCIILTSIILTSITTIGDDVFENWVMLVRK